MEASTGGGGGMIRVVPIEGKGRGVIATQVIHAGAVIDVSPVVLVPPIPDEGQQGNHPIENYQFNWDNLAHAVVMGPTSFCNHSSNPNCSFHELRETNQMLLMAIDRIFPGEELTIDYDCQLWFTPHE
jgi:SET domain-containing protein